MKKILFYVCIFIFVNGFTMNYNITVNENKTVTEQIEVINSKENIELGLNSSKILFNMENSLKDYKIEIKENNPDHLIATKEHYNLTELNHSIVFDDFVVSKNFTKNSMLLIPNYEVIRYAFDERDGYDGEIKSNITINFTVPFTVINNNADKTEYLTYIWDISNSLKEEYKIEFKNSQLFTNIERDKVINIALVVILICIGIAVIGFIGYSIYKFKNRNNGI